MLTLLTLTGNALELALNGEVAGVASDTNSAVDLCINGRHHRGDLRGANHSGRRRTGAPTIK